MENKEIKNKISVIFQGTLITILYKIVINWAMRRPSGPAGPGLRPGHAARALRGILNSGQAVCAVRQDKGMAADPHARFREDGA